MKASSNKRRSTASASPPVVVVVDAQVVDVVEPQQQQQPSKQHRKLYRRQRKQQWWTQWGWVLIAVIVALAAGAIWLAQLDDEDHYRGVNHPKMTTPQPYKNPPPTLPPLIELTDTRSLEEIQKEYDNLELNIPYTANKDGGVQLHINRTELLKFLVARSRTKQKLQQALLAEEKDEGDDDDDDGDSSLLDYHYWGGTNEDDDYDDAISESPQLQSLTENGDEL